MEPLINIVLIKSLAVQDIMKNTIVDTFNHQVSVKYLYKMNQENQDNYSDRVIWHFLNEFHQIPYNFII